MLYQNTKRFFWSKLKENFKRRKFIPMIKMHRFKKEDLDTYEKRLADYEKQDAPFILLKIKNKDYDNETKNTIQRLIQNFKG